MSASGRAKVLLLATYDTKSEVVDYLLGLLRALQLDATLVDISLPRGEDKLPAMQKAAASAAEQIKEQAAQGQVAVLVAIGGATGVQIFSDTCAILQSDVQKVIITTASADVTKLFVGEQVLVLLSPADLVGTNYLMCDLIDEGAVIINALSGLRRKARLRTDAVAITVSALGITQGFVKAACAALGKAQAEATVFHTTYYGGRALCRWLASGTCTGLLDATTHELTSLLFDPHSPVPEGRFSFSPELPRVVLPGAVNVRTIGPLASFRTSQLTGKYYQHSEEFTHLALSNEQLEQAGAYLGEKLLRVRAEQLVILPMGGFSSEDRPGGAVENAAGRECFAAALQTALADRVEIVCRDEHINDPALGNFAVKRLMALLPKS